MSESDTDVSSYLKAVRKEGGLTQLDLSKVMGNSESSTQAYEKGTRKMSAPRLRFFKERLKEPKNLRTMLDALQVRAELLDKERIARDWSIDTLAEKAGVPYGITYDVLHGWYAHPEYMEKILRALGMVVDTQSPTPASVPSNGITLADVENLKKLNEQALARLIEMASKELMVRMNARL